MWQQPNQNWVKMRKSDTKQKAAAHPAMTNCGKLFV